jgi:hypothetical protein
MKAESPMAKNLADKSLNMDLFRKEHSEPFRLENGKYIRPTKEEIKIDPKEAQAISTRLYQEAKTMKAKKAEKE